MDTLPSQENLQPRDQTKRGSPVLGVMGKDPTSQSVRLQEEKKKHKETQSK